MSHSMSIAKRTQLAGLLLLGCMSMAMAADKLGELSDDFLEYLGSLEGDDESWLDFTAEAVTSREPAAKQDAKVPSKAGSSSSSAATTAGNPASSTNTNAASKQTGKAE